MAINAANIRTSIIELLEGDIGSIRTLTAAEFKFGVFEGQSVTAQQAKTLDTSTGVHWFDVQLGSLTRHPASTHSALHSRRIARLDVTIPVWTRLSSTVQETQRKSDLANIESDLDDAVQALHYPDNLQQTAAAGATNIISGLLLGPGEQAGPPEWSLVELDWEDQLARHVIRGSALLNISQATS